MIRGLWVSASALKPAQQAQEILANNLANVATPGFRQDRFAFREALAQAQGSGGLVLPGGGRAPEGSPVLSGQIDMAPGTLEMTNNPLDLSLVGPGFFVVEGPDGPLYTRSGSLMRDPEGQLLHRSGYPIQSEGGTIEVPPDATFAVGNDGTVRINGEEQGKLRVVDLDVSTMSHAGKNLIRSTSAGEAIESPQVVQGASEASNVSTVDTMIDMMSVLRTYEANQSAIMTQDQSLAQLLRWANP